MRNPLIDNEFILLNTAYVSLGKDWNYQNVISPFYRLYYIPDGAGTVTFENRALLLRPGHLYLIPSFTLSNYECQAHLKQYYLHFEEVATQGLSLKSSYQINYEVAAEATDEHLFRRLIEINPGRSLVYHNPRVAAYSKGNEPDFRRARISAYEMETKGIILQLLSRFIGSELLPGHSNRAHYSRISKALQHIHAHLNQPLTVSSLSAVVNLNADYFSRVFQEITGMRPLPYINQLRVQKAQQLLIFTDAPQDEVADAVGFGNRTYFAKVFKEHTGQTAGEYRNQVREV